MPEIEVVAGSLGTARNSVQLWHGLGSVCRRRAQSHGEGRQYIFVVYLNNCVYIVGYICLSAIYCKSSLLGEVLENSRIER